MRSFTALMLVAVIGVAISVNAPAFGYERTHSSRPHVRHAPPVADALAWLLGDQRRSGPGENRAVAERAAP